MRLRNGLLSSIVILASAHAVCAQGQNSSVGKPPSLTPTVSPYVLLRRGASPGINYFGIVRPQQQFRQSLGQLESRVQQDESAAAADASAPLTTGHPAYFFNFSHYFPSLTSSPTTPRRLTTTSSSRPASAASSRLRRF